MLPYESKATVSRIKGRGGQQMLTSRVVPRITSSLHYEEAFFLLQGVKKMKQLSSHKFQKRR